MVIELKEDRLVTLPQLRQFVEGTTEVEFRRCGKDEDRYRHIEGVLRRFGYPPDLMLVYEAPGVA